MEFQRFEPLASADWCVAAVEETIREQKLFVNIGFVGSVFGSQSDFKI